MIFSRNQPPQQQQQQQPQHQPSSQQFADLGEEELGELPSCLYAARAGHHIPAYIGLSLHGKFFFVCYKKIFFHVFMEIVTILTESLKNRNFR